MGPWITDGTVVECAYSRVQNKIRRIERKIHKGGSTQTWQSALRSAKDELCDLETVKNLAEYVRNSGCAQIAQFR
jgi:hypothetical protein